MTPRDARLTHSRTTPADPARVVVLGGGGFIGGRLRASLESARIQTLAPGRRELDLAGAEAGHQLQELLRPGDAVVVLAALTPDKGRGLGPFTTNVAIAGGVCAALEKVETSHIVYFSSDSVYGNAAGLLTERSCAEPADLYGMMHLTREMMIRASARGPVAVLRSTLVFGAADTHNSYGPNRLRRMALKEGKIVLFGEGEEMRDHVFVEDVAALMIEVLRHRSAGVLNVASGRAISYADLARKVARLFDRPIDIVGTPRQTPITHRHFDVAAFYRAFPSFAFTPLDEGLARAHREMLERG